MTTFMVVSGDIRRNRTPCLAGCRIVMVIDLFVLNAPPEPLNKDVVEGPPAPIHAHRREGCGQLQACKVAALVHIEDRRRGERQRSLGGVEHKGQF